jgi:hypothetical protein
MVDKNIIDEYFTRAGIIYNQQHTLYVSPKSIAGFSLCVLPERETYVFTTYSIGDQDDINIIRRSDVLKAFNCNLCPIESVKISGYQNSYTTDTPSSKLSETYTGLVNGTKFIISATSGEYLPNHLLFVSAEHIPTYNIFLEQTLFIDLFGFLHYNTTKNSMNLIAIFNGRSGSNISHFHVHLSNYEGVFINDLLSNLDTFLSQDITYITENDRYFNMCVLAKNNPEELFNLVYKNVYTNYIIPDNTNNLSCIFLKRTHKEKDVYILILMLTSSDLTKKMYIHNNCVYTLMSSALIISAGCIDTRMTKIEYDILINQLKTHYNTFFLPLTDIFKNDTTLALIGRIPSVIVDFEKSTIEEQIVVLHDIIIQKLGFNNLYKLKNNIKIDITNAYTIIEHLLYPLYNNKEYTISIMYILSIIIRRLSDVDYNILLNSGNDIFTNIQLQSVTDIFKNYSVNTGKEDNGITRSYLSGNYLYFKGQFIQHLIKKNLTNLLLITQKKPLNILDLSESNHINDWIDFNFKQIGEPSAYGTNTVSKIKDFDIDFVMKIQISRGTRDHYVERYYHEFFASLSVNNIRDVIPNFVLCYGGFLCNTTDFRTNLCNGGIGLNNTTYLLLENIKHSKTLSRSFRIPHINTPYEADNILDILYQILTSLAIAMEVNDFTHYDLHSNNILEYNFIENSDFLNLFKHYNEGTIPKVENCLFEYYFKDDTIIIMPVKYLYVIIDYGFTYTKDLPKNKIYVSERHVQSMGATSNKSNPLTDTFCVIMDCLFHTICYTPYNIFDIDITTNAYTWKINNLTDFFYNFLHNYVDLWRMSTPDIINVLALTRFNNAQEFANFFISITHTAYIGCFSFNRLHKDFVLDTRSNFSTALNIIKFMKEHYYDAKNLNNLKTTPHTYTYVWGTNIPSGINQGIQPNGNVISNIRNKEHMHRQKIENVKDFLTKI